MTVNQTAGKFSEVLRNIRLVCLDVDGVLTDGTIVISADGELFKPFFVRDGLGIKLLQDCGIQVAICTGRSSDIVKERARELGISLVMQGQKDKREGLKEICAKAGVTPAQTAYMGDDVPDLCLFPLVGFSAAPKDASALISGAIMWQSSFEGGKGAVRELAEVILTAQGRLKEAVFKRFQTEMA